MWTMPIAFYAGNGSVMYPPLSVTISPTSVNESRSTGVTAQVINSNVMVTSTGGGGTYTLSVTRLVNNTSQGSGITFTTIGGGFRFTSSSPFNQDIIRIATFRITSTGSLSGSDYKDITIEHDYEGLQ